ncbi:MAG TPA: hypothetical protein VFT22_34275 [Kofleriaceae bacterium]|nr:hypothetical protein [Kofleriaceae bacterium]
MMRGRWLPFLVVIVPIVAGAPGAHAQSASTQAQSLFDDGQRQMQAGKFAEACAAFESSQKLEPVVTTQLNLADCREQNHQLATAWGAFLEANRMAQAIGDARLARVATSHAKKLEPRLSRLTIAVPPDHQVPGLEVLRGNERVLPAVWNHAVAIDGGTYTITARAPGYASWSIARSIKDESDPETVEIPKLVEARPSLESSRPTTTAGAGGHARAPASGAPASREPAAPSAPPASRRTASVATGAAGAADRRPQDGAPRAADAPPAAPAGSPASRPSPAPSAAPLPHDEHPPPVAGASPPPDSPAPSESPAGWRAYRWPIAVGAGALVLGGVALGSSLLGDRSYDQAKHALDQARQDSLYNRANTFRYVAEGFGLAAAGCAGVAVYLAVRAHGRVPTESTAVAPVASPQFAGLAIAGSW